MYGFAARWKTTSKSSTKAGLASTSPNGRAKARQLSALVARQARGIALVDPRLLDPAAHRRLGEIELAADLRHRLARAEDQLNVLAFPSRLRHAGLLASTCTVGDALALDNAVAEAFWDRMQVELLNRPSGATGSSGQRDVRVSGGSSRTASAAIRRSGAFRPSTRSSADPSAPGVVIPESRVHASGGRPVVSAEAGRPQFGSREPTVRSSRWPALPQPAPLLHHSWARSSQRPWVGPQADGLRVYSPRGSRADRPKAPR